MVSEERLQAVVMPRLSDIFHSTEEALELLVAFAKAGVTLVCTRTDFDSSRAYSGSDLATLVLDAVAEASVERRVIAMGTAIQRGRRIGRPRVRVDAEALHVLLAKGVPLRQVAHDVRVGYGTVQRLHAASAARPRS